MTSPLVAAWSMSNEANLFLLKHIKPAWLGDRYGARTRTVAAQFSHMHNVRVWWLEVMAKPLAEGLEAFPRGAEPDKTELRKALVASEKGVAKLFAGADPEGGLKQWNGPPATFLGYLVAHEGHHRGLAMVALRAAGRKPGTEVVQGQWDWGKRHSAR